MREGQLGQLPRQGERLPTLRMPQLAARVIGAPPLTEGQAPSAGFFFKGRVPAIDEVITGDSDDMRGLANRGLVELLPS